MSIVVADAEMLYKHCKGSKELLNCSFLKEIYSVGGYIAGGFLRKLIRDRNCNGLPEYFGKNSSTITRSDIDIFFTNNSAIRELKKKRSKYFVQRSIGNNAAAYQQASSEFENHPAIHFPVTIQFVDCSLCEPSKMIESFDFENCMAAFDGEKFYYSDNLFNLENDRVLHAVRSSDIMGSRTLKYINRHNYESISAQTRTLLARWALDFYENGYPSMMKNKPVFDHKIIDKIVELDLFAKEELVSLLGKFKTIVNVNEYHDLKSERGMGSVRMTLVDPIQLCINADSVREPNKGDMVTLSTLDTTLKSAIFMHVDTYGKYVILSPDGMYRKIDKNMIIAVHGDSDE